VVKEFTDFYQIGKAMMFRIKKENVYRFKTIENVSPIVFSL
jgi:hypothetical protein